MLHANFLRLHSIEQRARYIQVLLAGLDVLEIPQMPINLNDVGSLTKNVFHPLINIQIIITIPNVTPCPIKSSMLPF